MKNKGIIQIFTILLVIACFYQLSFTWKAKQIENRAKEWSKKTGKSESNYLDSIGPLPVYNLLGLTKYSYFECKKRELNLGLDLKGGMNVTMEISVPDIVKSLSNKSEDPSFLKALESANNNFKGDKDFIDLFKEEYTKIAPTGRLASIFTNKDLKSELPYNSTNDVVYDWLRKQTGAALSSAFKIISTRIDNFGTMQPNVQELGNGRILVELPGVDNPKRVRDILQSSARLEFWNTYHNYETYKYLESANTVVKVLNDKNTKKDTTLKASSTDLKPATIDTSSLTGGLVAKEDSLKKGDTSKKADPKVSQEQQIKDNPILSKIYPNLRTAEDGKSQIWAEGAMVGRVSKRDMAELKKYFELPEVKNVLPPNLKLIFSFKADDENQSVFSLYGLKASKGEGPVLPGDVITNARKSTGQNSEIGVSMTMSPEGATQWKRITANAAKNQKDPDAIAIVLDDMVYSAPTVRSEIANGMSEITGGFTDQEALDLANILKAGKLPAPTRIVEESVVGPTLGKKAIDAGILSLIIGFFAVIVFVVAYYGRGGWYAVIALVFNLFFLLGILAGMGSVFTLSGLAGLVLTMGMAIDTNVLINERIKEELDNGKNYAAAVQTGYKQAFSAILDSNLTTLIGGIIMYVLGQSAVKGFAIVLIIGIFTSLFTGILISRLFNEWDLSRGNKASFVTNLSRNLFKNTNYAFVGKRKMFYWISGVFLTIGIISMIFKGFSTGVDFKGGWTYTIQFHQNTNSGDIKTALNNVIKENIEVKTYGTGDQYRITTAYLIDDKSADAADKVETTIVTALKDFKINKKDILSSSKIGPTIASDVKRDSFIAVILAVIGIFLFIIIRFRRLSYGMGGFAALVHDVLAVLALFSIFYGILPFPLDVDQAFIGAILTVLGYSINDTVVVFDRIREFLGINKYEDNQPKIINDAINQTLSRTVVTASTSIITLLILFIFGGEGLKGFTFALLAGILIGTYSSIFIASPVVVDMAERLKKKEK